MPDLKISQLTGGGAAQATDEFPNARSGANFKITGANIAAAATSVGTLTSLTVSGNLTVDTNTLFVDAANNRVGIGTASPAHLLDVDSTADADLVRIRSTASANNTIMRLGISGNNAVITASGGSTGTLQFNVYGSERARITETGAFVIGNGTTNASPTTALLRGTDGTGTDIAGAEFRITGGQGTGSGAGGPITFYTSAAGATGTTLRTATERMRLDSAGNLGLGVTPSAWSGATALQVRNSLSLWSQASGSARYANNVFFDGSVRKYIFTGTAAEYEQGGGIHEWKIAASGTAGNNITFTTAMTLDASGNLGVGTTSPNLTGFNKEITVSAGTSGTARAGINIQGSRTTASTFGALSFYHQANLVGSIEMIRGGADNSGAMQFFTTNAGTSAERARIPAAGGFQVVGAISVGNATPVTSGAGVTFPATQSASTDANTLDDYEEGVFDPTITFGGASVGVTYNTSFTKGSYTKVGNRVFVGGYIILTSKGSSTGDASIGGLPFTSASGNTRLQGATVALLNVTFANQFWARIAANVTTIDFYESTEAGVASTLTNADFANNSEVYFTAHYAIS